MIESICKLFGISRAPTQEGLAIYKTLYALEARARKVKDSRLTKLLKEHHAALDHYRKCRGRSLPDDETIVILGGGGGKD